MEELRSMGQQNLQRTRSTLDASDLEDSNPSSAAPDPLADHPAVVDLGIEGIGPGTRIGQGGFGVVYKARQEAFARTVAVKVLSVPATDDESIRRFERECHAVGLLSGHPHIVAVHGVGRTATGQPYLVMDYLPGGTLAERLKHGGPFDPSEVADIGVKLADALVAAHSAGVLHRDIKPENILISAYGQPELADFGIARIEGGTETLAGVITGTIAYSAPEVLAGRPATEASDVYSLASTLFTLVAGEVPFSRTEDETVQPLVARIMTDKPPDLRLRGVPDALCTVLELSMAKDPAERIATALAFGEALQEAQRSAGWEPTPLLTAEGDAHRAVAAKNASSSGRTQARVELSTQEQARTGPSQVPMPAARPAGDAQASQAFEQAATVRRERPWSPVLEPSPSVPSVRRRWPWSVKPRYRRVGVGAILSVAVGGLLVAVVAITGGHKVPKPGPVPPRPTTTVTVPSLDATRCDATQQVTAGHLVQFCPLWRGDVPVYSVETGKPDGVLNAGGDANWFVGQEMAVSYTFQSRTNNWWAFTEADDGQWGWVPEVFFAGGGNNRPDGGLFVCGSRGNVCSP